MLQHELEGRPRSADVTLCSSVLLLVYRAFSVSLSFCRKRSCAPPKPSRKAVCLSLNCFAFEARKPLTQLDGFVTDDTPTRHYGLHSVKRCFANCRRTDVWEWVSRDYRSMPLTTMLARNRRGWSVLMSVIHLVTSPVYFCAIAAASNPLSGRT